MRALVLNKQIEPLPIQSEESFIDSYEGFLNSNYKQIAKENFFHSKPKSIFGIKQRVKAHFFQHSSGIETLLKLSVFAIVLAYII